MRAKFSQREDSDPTLGWDFLTSKQPVWITGPDAVAAKLITGKAINILKAFAIAPRGVQAGLRPVKLYDQLEIDPLRDDLAMKIPGVGTAMEASAG